MKPYSGLSARLETSLRMLSQQAMRVDEDWIIIGSTAANLMGADIEPEDVDVLGTSESVSKLLALFGRTGTEKPGHPLFRSAVFERIDIEGGLPLEFMGDLTLVHGDDRTPVKARTRIAVDGAFGTVYAPSLEEQIQLLRRFGRDKDLARIPLLEAVLDRKAG